MPSTASPASSAMPSATSRSQVRYTQVPTQVDVSGKAVPSCVPWSALSRTLGGAPTRQNNRSIYADTPSQPRQRVSRLSLYFRRSVPA
jgi:hypothetical protein